ncbi:Nuclear cap-binding protein subunit 1, partial [Coemansia spiralis]
THYSQWVDIEDDERQALAREMLVEHVLLLGSKTFSHMLNAIEKFMPALQQFGDTPAAKLQIARTVEDFWLRNPQFCAITIDKLVNYRVIDPVTVVEMLFDPSHAGGWGSFHLWEILRNTITKVNMRVVQLQTRLAAARVAADAAAEAAADAMAADGPDAPEQAPAPSASETVEHVEAILAQMEREQKDVIVLTARHFVQLLASADGLDRAWLLGRFKEFMRTYRAQVAANATELESQVFTGAAGPEARQIFDATRLLAA